MTFPNLDYTSEVVVAYYRQFSLTFPNSVYVESAIVSSNYVEVTWAYHVDGIRIIHRIPADFWVSVQTQIMANRELEAYLESQIAA